ncbi:MAG: hypothetical protein ABI143_02235 [Caldimonas sp.]
MAIARPDTAKSINGPDTCHRGRKIATSNAGLDGRFFGSQRVNPTLHERLTQGEGQRDEHQKRSDGADFEREVSALITADLLVEIEVDTYVSD